MKLINNGNIISLENIVFRSEYDGYPCVDKADIVLNNMKVGTYIRNELDFDIDMQYLYVFEEMADIFFDKYPKGILTGGKYRYPLKELWENNYVEGLLVELASMNVIEKSVNDILQKNNFCMIAQKNKKSSEEMYGVHSIQEKEDLTKNNIIVFIAEKGKDNFSFEI